jgi:hypothetical protein
MALHRRAAAIKLGILRRLEIGGNFAFDLVSVERYLAALMAESAKLHATFLPQPTHAYERRSGIRAGVRPSLWRAVAVFVRGYAPQRSVLPSVM